ncbi:efflux transporter periplasmic adaptor subunit [Malaciobacter molluscorum LMG 25693]|uniref:Efflux transporter periplasmic adaptor subunit n=1 Tax=Malaciobacter molluscorum LMG 25693 TaxID=870501 RepID=A0A2G1DLL0_9BACT|nr:efflux RND transporter periplasmic adaptor subunit [Malaciobacter molluscorum]AXX92148.1 RND family efflux system, membrane fusion protein [Malaciobacter molluscorum LMG 25693]PHO19377.1 efflux transporter periplasmic adaptor subunit [Malaciobacter molluscorum LMG 25693]
MKFCLKSLFLLFITIFLLGCENQGKNNFSEEEQKIEVGYITLNKQEVPLQQELSGRIKAIYKSEVRPQIDGIIKKQLFKEGTYVNKGDILYEIDSDSYLATYNEALATLKSSEANLITLKLKKQRYEKSVKFSVVSQQDVDDAKAAYLQAAALVEQNKASLKSAKINLDRTKIKAQISGFIGISNYTIGSLVLANQTNELTTIRDTSRVYADLSQSNNQLFKLKKITKNNNKKQDIPVNIILPDNSRYAHSGILKLQEISVDEDTGYVTLRAEFPNPEGELLDNMFVNTIIDIGTYSNVFLVPQQAVTLDGKSNYMVTIIEKDNTIQKKTITVEKAVGNKWLVTDGLLQTDKIIVEGLNKINKNSIVIPKNVNNLYVDNSKKEVK